MTLHSMSEVLAENTEGTDFQSDKAGLEEGLITGQAKLYPGHYSIKYVNGW